MEKFTKGPWHIDDDLKAIYNYQCNYICDYPLNNKHDKYLIAAAPKMYKMLNNIMELSNSDMGNLVDGMLCYFDEIEDLLKEARIGR